MTSVTGRLTGPKRELWLAWYVTVAFYGMYSVIFFGLSRTQPPGPAVARSRTRRWTGSPTATGACSSASG